MDLSPCWLLGDLVPLELLFGGWETPQRRAKGGATCHSGSPSGVTTGTLMSQTCGRGKRRGALAGGSVSPEEAEEVRGGLESRQLAKGQEEERGDGKGEAEEEGQWRGRGK